MARQKEFETPTYRLGGGRSILLSYWRIYWNIVAKKPDNVNREGKFMYQYNLQQDSADSERRTLYTIPPTLKGGEKMRECNDPNVDLDDLIFDEDDGGPSER